ncbi:hypothetical protein [Chitinophaga cymbidii]|uniref:Uncharacterized protein n=1 Tax=Chitinophaga cymbidii TaxID=1096750 RepID=A0A512RHE8_9BACT|nr:hypothetical protein [Chitinophaga cymbidii]GEP95118.1 hypothetical protein CCY01nite_13780 [Chitinophaga cymbidii]
MPKKIRNLAMLDEEIARLKRKSRKLEDELGARVDHFKGNYKSMAMNSVVPGIANSGVMGIVGNVAKIAWSSSKAKSVLSTALITALEFIGVRLGLKLVNNFQRKRRRRKAAAKAAGESNGEEA